VTQYVRQLAGFVVEANNSALWDQKEFEPLIRSVSATKRRRTLNPSTTAIAASSIAG
jgi:hypothetical protein